MHHRHATRHAYAARIERVAAYIAANLDGPLDLQRLAEVACFSPYHFHRIYRLTMGETPDQTVRRLRLNRAAASLGHGDLPLAAIAKRAGYASVEAFSRAFSQAYGQPPSRYRAQRAPTLGPPSPEDQTSMYAITIKDFTGLRIAGLPHQGDYNAVGGTFERLMALAAPHGLIRPSSRCIGIYYDDPGATPVAELRAFVGVDVSDDVTTPDGIETVVLEPCPIAVLRHKGPYADLERAYNYLYGEWLPTSGREPADRPAFEDYLNDCRSLPATEWLTDICLPLAP